ncbi:hypothetical protein Tco_1435379, partial [Tanacetum coccineum]
KEMSFSQLKIVIATIICHYHFELVEGHPVVPKDSMVLQMKDGLKLPQLVGDMNAMHQYK